MLSDDDVFIQEILAVALSSLEGAEHWVVLGALVVWVVSGRVPPFLKKAIQRIAAKKK